jgi:hypothetical protein
LEDLLHISRGGTLEYLDMVNYILMQSLLHTFSHMIYGMSTLWGPHVLPWRRSRRFQTLDGKDVQFVRLLLGQPLDERGVHLEIGHMA